jgi:hypothetical protein
MQNTVNKFALQSDTEIQTRRAQNVDLQFSEAIRNVLKANNRVIDCYLLDARKPDTEEIIQIIALTVEDEAKDIDIVSQQLWEMLQKFPDRKGKTFMMSSVTFKDDYLGSEFYVRGGENTFSHLAKKFFSNLGLGFRK